MAGFETLNAARGKLARKAGAFNARHARGRGLPAIILMTDDMRDVDWVEAVRALPPGSAVVVRQRDARRREELARQLRGVCATRRIKLLIADDDALALRVRADGVHVPQRHVAKAPVLKALHPRWFVSVSAHDAASAGRAARAGADAILIAPVFATASHPGAKTLGVVRLSAMTQWSPTYALGGVDAKSIGRLTGARLSGVAVIGGWTKN
jgi:thiamine-phosphate pyrophosphorylase